MRCQHQTGNSDRPQVVRAGRRGLPCIARVWGFHDPNICARSAAESFRPAWHHEPGICAVGVHVQRLGDRHLVQIRSSGRPSVWADGKQLRPGRRDFGCRERSRRLGGWRRCRFGRWRVHGWGDITLWRIPSHQWWRQWQWRYRNVAGRIDWRHRMPGAKRERAAVRTIRRGEKLLDRLGGRHKQSWRPIGQPGRIRAGWQRPVWCQRQPGSGRPTIG